MFALIGLPCVCVMLLGCANSASFDQSQSGNLNVQVDLKDLQIIALMKGGKEEYVDYDYAYDYNEMTIKPQNGTTPRPLNTTTITNATDYENDNTTQSDGSVSAASGTTVSGVTASFQTSTAQVPSAAQPSGNLTADVATPSSTLSTTESSANTTTNGCKKGFAPNQKGDCELKLQNVGTNALLKLVKLSQKLKLRREKRTTTERRG